MAAAVVVVVVSTAVVAVVVSTAAVVSTMVVLALVMTMVIAVVMPGHSKSQCGEQHENCNLGMKTENFEFQIVSSQR